MRRISTLLAAIGCAMLAGAAQAQTYPERTVKIIVPQPAGGGFDTVARVVADRMSTLLGQPFIVENRPGAGTVVGTDAAAKATPDGYTLLLGGASNMALNVGLYPKLAYDPVRDFRAVGMVVSWPYMLVARKDLPQKSFKDLIAFARANPEKLTYASAGRGTGQHIAAAVAFHLAGVNVLHVPYSGAQAAYQDVMGDRIDVFFDNASTALPQVKGGAVTALAVSTAKRYAAMPDVPSVKETGLADLDMESWFGLFAPAATPAPVMEKLRGALAKVVADPTVIDLFGKSGGTMSSLTPAQSEAYAKSEAERWGKLVREAGVTAE